MIRAKFFTRTALGLTLALGLAAGAASPVLAKDKDKKPAEVKISPTKPFIPGYVAAKNAIEAASKRADVLAARQKCTDAIAAMNNAKGKKAQADAKVNYDAASAALITILAPERVVVDKASVAATSADDKYLAGQLQLNLGNLAFDKQLQRSGIKLQIESGKISATDLPKYYGILGSLEMEQKDYASARVSLKTAIDGGYTEGGMLVKLADSYIRDNQPAAGLKILQDAVVKAGPSAPEDWMRYGVATAYRAKLPQDAATFASELVANYPTTENWSLAIAVVRDLFKFQGQDQIDLLRLMQRTKSFLEERDYVEYIQSADPKRLPGEALKIINEGLAAGKLRADDAFVIDSKSQAMGRIAADKASLPALERDARAAGASAATASSAGDAFLSYDMPAKAEEMYRLALTKPGVDTTRVLIRLGIAQVDQAKYADAQANFAKVTDARAPIAQLWSTYAKNKIAGK